MKKQLLLLAIFIISITLTQAQSLSFSQGGTDISNSNITKNPIQTDSPFSHIVDIKNNSASSIDVKVFKRDDNIIAGTEAAFCFNGGCWPSSQDTCGNGSQTINAGVTTSGLTSITCEFTPNGNTGTSVVDYVVYDVSNMADSTSVRVTYDVSTDIDGNLITNSLVSYPNPANNEVNFKYNLNSKISKIQIFNVVGNLVESINLNSNLGVYSINTANYKQGAYFYTFIVNGKTVSTNKLIIAH